MMIAGMAYSTEKAASPIDHAILPEELELQEAGTSPATATEDIRNEEIAPAREGKYRDRTNTRAPPLAHSCKHRSAIHPGGFFQIARHGIHEVLHHPYPVRHGRRDIKQDDAKILSYSLSPRNSWYTGTITAVIGSDHKQNGQHKGLFIFHLIPGYADKRARRTTTACQATSPDQSDMRAGSRAGHHLYIVCTGNPCWHLERLHRIRIDGSHEHPERAAKQIPISLSPRNSWYTGTITAVIGSDVINKMVSIKGFLYFI